MAIRNFYCHFERVKDELPCSIGLHPWHLDHYTWDWKMLCKYVQQPNVLAIGECGLDRVCATDWDLQVKVFTEQIALANKCGKPMIVHCVRAFDEVLHMLQIHPPVMPVIFHGYNKNKAVAEKLLERGFYLSFGAAILNESFPASGVLKSMPASRFFLETDDAETSIEDIYTRAAQIRNTDTESLILQVQKNFKKVFTTDD